MRVFIAEDQFLLRQGLEQLLAARGAEVAGTAAEAVGLAATIEASGTELALLDIRMPPTGTDEGLRTALELRARRPGFPVVLLSQYVEQLYLDELLAAGGAGVRRKSPGWPVQRRAAPGTSPTSSAASPRPNRPSRSRSWRSAASASTSTSS